MFAVKRHLFMVDLSLVSRTFSGRLNAGNNDNQIHQGPIINDRYKCLGPRFVVASTPYFPY